MVSGVTYDSEHIILAIYEKKGVIADAAKKLNIERKVIYNAMKRDPAVEEAVNEARREAVIDRIDKDERIVQNAYEGIEYLIKTNDPTAILFALKCKGKWSDKSGDIAQMGWAKTEVVDYSKAVDG